MQHNRRQSCISCWRYLLLTGIITLICWLPMSPVLAASAIGVPPEAHSIAQMAKAAYQEALYAKQAILDRLNAEEYALKAEFDLAEAEKQVNLLEKALIERTDVAEQAEEEAQIAMKQAEEAASRAEFLQIEAENALAASEEAYRAADKVDAELQAQEVVYQAAYQTWLDSHPARSEQVALSTAPAPEPAKTAQYRSIEETDELLILENEMKMMEKAQRDADQARRTNISMVDVADTGNYYGEEQFNVPEVDWSRGERAHAHAAYMNQLYEAAERKAEEAWRLVEEKSAHWETAKVKADQARILAADTRQMLNDTLRYLPETRQYAFQSRKNYEELVSMQENPPGSHYASIDMNYYRWSDKYGNTGYQFIQPIYVGHWEKKFSYSLSTNYVISQNNTAGYSGRVSTFTDTNFYMVRRSEKPKFTIDYGLSINIPTGKSALSWNERYARMPEDLVQTNEFGKGWQFRPSVIVSWKNGKEDRWTVGTSYTFSRSYDPTSDIANDDITPGGEWGKFLRWQHAEEGWQFVGEIFHTLSNSTKIANGESYEGGGTWEYRLTYNRVLNRNQDLMFYYWRENQNVSSADIFNGNGRTHYLGTMWSRRLDNKRTFRVTFDTMKSEGTRYSGIYNYYDADNNARYTTVDVDGRTKYTFGLGYDVSINATTRISVDLQRFTMKDGRSTRGDPETSYSGFNVLLKASRSF